MPDIRCLHTSRESHERLIQVQQSLYESVPELEVSDSSPINDNQTWTSWISGTGMAALESVKWELFGAGEELGLNRGKKLR